VIPGLAFLALFTTPDGFMERMAGFRDILEGSTDSVFRKEEMSMDSFQKAISQTSRTSPAGAPTALRRAPAADRRRRWLSFANAIWMTASTRIEP
jgi:hypothetical protein